MKRVNKVLSIFLVLVCVISVIPMSANAVINTDAPEFQLVPNTISANVGDIVSVDVIVENNSRLCGLVADVRYNPSAFKVVDVVSAGAFGDSEIINPEYSSGSVRFVGTTTSYIDDNATKLFTVSFEVLNTCGEIYMLLNEAYVAGVNAESVNVTFGSNLSLRSVEIHDYADYVCNVCGHKTAVVTIEPTSRTTIRYKDGIVLHANIQGDMEGLTVKWTANNNNFTKTEDGNNLTIISNSDGDTIFTVSVYDDEGTLLSSDSVEMSSKAGFFDKFVGFFLDLFGLTVIYAK